MKNKKSKKIQNQKNDKSKVTPSRLKNRFVAGWLFVLTIIRKDRGHIVLFLSILIIVTMYFGIGTLFLPLFDTTSSTGISSLNGAVTLNPSRPTINLIFGEPDWSTNSPLVSTKFDGKVKLPNKPLWKDGGCFDFLYYLPDVETSRYIRPVRMGGSSGISIDPKFCFSGTKKEIPTAPSKNLIIGDPITYISGSPPYYYPFDWAEINVSVGLGGYENIGDKTEIRHVPVNITGEVDAKNWDTKSYVLERIYPPSFPGEESTSTVIIKVRYERLLVYRVIPVVLLATILLIILLMPWIKDDGTFLEVLIGLIFGIWGIKQVIIPTFVTWTTILEPIILGLYMCLCISVFIKFFLMPLHARADKLAKHENE